MNILVPILLASFLPAPETSPQNPPKRLPPKTGRITLPPVTKRPQPKQGPVRVRNDASSFYRDVIDLRRSKTLKPVDEELILVDLQQNYDDPAKMAVELAKRAKNDLLHGLMKVIDRYGDKYHADQLHFLILTKPIGRVTSRVVKTITDKVGSERAKSYLFDYLTAKYSPVRAAAAKLLPNYLSEEDIPRLLQISRERKTDVRKRVVGILAGIDDPRVRQRILQMLTQDAALGAAACVAAVRHGMAVAEELAAIVRRPARGRSFGYAAFALAKIEKNTGQMLLTKDMVPNLARELGGSNAFLKATSAIALGTYAHRAADWSSRGNEDKRIVDGLLGLVAPDEFITSLQLLQPAAVEVLVKFSGRNFQTQASGWRGWWQEARPKFVGLRRSVAVTDANAERALLLWSAGEHELSFHGPAVDAEAIPEGSTSFILGPTEMQKLLEDLRSLGFMADHDLPQTKETWAIDLRIDGARAVLTLDPDRGEGFHRSFAEVAQREMWQKYRDPEAQPDAAAFWRVEQKWLAKNPGQEARRLLWHVVRRLPSLDAAGRVAALDDLQSIPGLPKLVTADDAGVLIDVAKKVEEFRESDFRLLEVALLAPGDTTWRKVIGVLDGRVSGAGDALATRVFRMLGPEKVVTSIRHKSGAIAVAAMHDCAANRNHAAVPVLMARMKDADVTVRRTAIYALGALRAAQARAELIAQEPKASPVVRREIWGALGRIGGPQVPAILKRAMESPVVEDKLAALTAMGHTQSTELAQFLAARFVTQSITPDAFSLRAELSLRRLGPLMAIPALRPHLQMQEGPARHRLVLLLGDFQDAMVVRDLIDLLRSKQHEVGAARYLAEITGVDLRKVDERARRMYAWFADNRAKGQAQWFLTALAANRIPTRLEPSHLIRRSGIAAVEELTRLMVAVEESHIRVMCATMLRETTGKDFTRGIRHADEAARTAIADRYKIYASSVRAAANK